VTASPRQPPGARATRALVELAALVDGVVVGDGSVLISGVAGLEQAGPGHLSFYGNQKYKRQLLESKASAVLVGRDDDVSALTVSSVRVANPHLAFARIAQEFVRQVRVPPGVAVGAFVHPGATIDSTASVLAGATISEGAVIKARAVIGAGSFVGERVVIGDDTRLVANVSVLDDCLVGARCLLHPGVVIGADGFGFAFDGEQGQHVKIPQTGSVRIEDDVEIGANSCVDRATTGETVVGHGSKIDNLVQVGHNSLIGPLSILCAQVGLSGTSVLGTGVVLAGQVGIAGHLKVGDLARVAAQSGVISDVADGATVMGSPSLPHREHLRIQAASRLLPALQKTLKALTRRLEALEQKSTKP